MNKIFLVFPNQLFEDISVFLGIDKIFLIEDPLFFGDKNYPLKFHKLKLILHRASMKFYFEYLVDNDLKVEYVDYLSLKDYKVTDFYKKIFINHEITTYDPVDYILKKRIIQAANEVISPILFIHNKLFINSAKDNNEYIKSSTTKNLLQTNFYIWQRKRLKLFIDQNNKPLFDQWSFDTDNRKKLPANLYPPKLHLFKLNNYVLEAINYVEKNFVNNPPFINPENMNNTFYPTTFEEAKLLLNDFLEQRILQFGPYQDAITDKSEFVFHSVLSSSLNIGLITPTIIIETVMQKFLQMTNLDQHKHYSSFEGFIRQIIGWREFIRLTYEQIGTKLRNSNFFNHNKQLPHYWYTAETDNELIKETILKVFKFAYAHHIERLMIIGNYMLLDEIHPNEVYNWFMEMFIDSYDWVMVPNIYGMSQYSDGGNITTKPYISGAHYLIKMGAKKGKWVDDWNEKFWKFIERNFEVLNKNPRMKFICSQYSKLKKRETLQ